MSTVLESDRLRLEAVRPDHAAALGRLVFDDPEVMQFSDGPVDVEAWIAGALQSYEANGYGPWLVVDKETDEPLGYCGLFSGQVNGKPEVEIGYRLGRSAQGKGYATEAVKATLGYATGHGIRRVVALIDPSNHSSLRVAEKAGFVHETDVMFPGYTHPDGLYVAEL
ncbi:MAG TPA: GNAT family N-acetyltransferase [Candidatus Saccharimonadales bacterium]|nr:GNAT family N-acetyltransferase [Candidatus Saccharimonadales bacterium]